MPLEGRLFHREPIPQATPFEAREISSEIPEINDTQLEIMAETLRATAEVLVMRAQDMLHQPDLLKQSPRPQILEHSLRYGGSVIIDTGTIDNLLLALPKAEQSFSTTAVAAALRRSGHLDSTGTYLKFGTSGAVLTDGSGAEVVEAQRIQSDNVALMSKMASRDPNGSITVARRPETTQRVLLENEFIVRENASDNRSIFLRLNVARDFDQDLMCLIDTAAQNSGLTHYTVRASIYGPVHGELAVLSALPNQPFENLTKILVVDKQSSTGTEDGKARPVQLVGSRSTASSRQSELWNKVTGQAIYPSNTGGHYHGYSENGQIGGHIRSLKPEVGAIVEIIIEPARVVQVTKTMQ